MKPWSRFSNPMSALTERSAESYEQQVKGPGKFEGEAAWVPYFYDVAGHGFADEEESWPEGGGWVGIFTVSDEAKKMFPRLRGKKQVAIHERSDGFVGATSVPDARASMREIQKSGV